MSLSDIDWFLLITAYNNNKTRLNHRSVEAQLVCLSEQSGYYL